MICAWGKILVRMTDAIPSSERTPPEWVTSHVMEGVFVMLLSGCCAGFTGREHLLPPCKGCFVKVEQARDILDRQPFGQKEERICHARLNDFGFLAVQRGQQGITVGIREDHGLWCSRLMGRSDCHSQRADAIAQRSAMAQNRHFRW